ncbi:MAG: lipid-A-disaccharide synthase [Deltaproteobacteria bacterium]|nr:lipid-A-disaccharide synthase [Deltaproteobacteria bacterium]
MIKLREVVRISGPSADSGGSRFVVIVAGEASADFHGSNLVKAMKKLNPQVSFKGIGGQKMRQAGVEILIPSSEMAVVGLTEVFSRLRTIFNASRKLKSLLKNGRPHLLILIDYPDFNIHIAKTAKRFHIPVLYYISPQIWAWRSGRVRKIGRRIDRMAVILPFEETFYKESGVHVEYVGHPVLDACPAVVDEREGVIDWEVHEGRPIVGLLPGSRREEIENLLPFMLKSAEMIAQRYRSARFLLPLAPTLEAEFVQTFIDNAKVAVEVIQDNIYEVLGRCQAALVTSGTATLEAAIMKIPMVVVYKTSPLSYWVGRHLVDVPFISLVNLVAGQEVVKELIQKDVTAERLAHEVLILLENKEARKNMIEKMIQLRKNLGMGGASARVARIALEMMEQKTNIESRRRRETSNPAASGKHPITSRREMLNGK